MNSIFTLHQFIQYSLFLFLALLLWTPNFSVVFAILLILLSLYYCIKNKQKRIFTYFDWLVLAIFSSYLIANLPNPIIDTGQFRYVESPIKILLCFPVYLMLKKELSKFDFRFWLEYGAALGALGAFGIACIQFFYYNYTRVDGFLFSINFGYLACSLAFLNLGFLPDSPRKAWLTSGFIAGIIATVLTLTRGAIIAIPILSVLFIFLNKEKFNKKNMLACFLIGSTVFFSSYFHSASIKNRVNYTILEIKNIAAGNTERATSSGGRLQLWSMATETFKRSPILGLTYPEREALADKFYQQGKTTRWVKEVSRGHAHSQYFEMLASNGILGIAAIIMMIFVPLILFYRHRTQTLSSNGMIFITGIAIFGLTEVLLQANLISFYFGILLAFFLASIQPELDILDKHNSNSIQQN